MLGTARIEAESCFRRDQCFPPLPEMKEGVAQVVVRECKIPVQSNRRLIRHRRLFEVAAQDMNQAHGVMCTSIARIELHCSLRRAYGSCQRIRLVNHRSMSLRHL